MADYDNTNRGALFINDRKTSPNQPDYKGSLDVEGVEYWVSAWVKPSRKGDLLSMSITPKTATGGVQQNHNQQAQNGARQLGQGNPQGGQGGWGNGAAGSSRPTSSEPPMDFDDDIPF